MDQHIDDLKEVLESPKTLIVEDVMWKNAIENEATYNRLISLFKVIDDKASRVRAFHTRHLDIFQNGIIPDTYEEMKGVLSSNREKINEAERIIHHWKTLEHFLKENPTAQCEWDALCQP